MDVAQMSIGKRTLMMNQCCTVTYFQSSPCGSRNSPKSWVTCHDLPQKSETQDWLSCPTNCPRICQLRRQDHWIPVDSTAKQPAITCAGLWPGTRPGLASCLAQTHNYRGTTMIGGMGSPCGCEDFTSPGITNGGSSSPIGPIGYEAFVQPQKGQPAKQDEINIEISRLLICNMMYPLVI